MRRFRRLALWQWALLSLMLGYAALLVLLMVLVPIGHAR